MQLPLLLEMGKGRIPLEIVMAGRRRKKTAGIWPDQRRRTVQGVKSLANIGKSSPSGDL